MKINRIFAILTLYIYDTYCECESTGLSWLPDPTDCNQFYLCSAGTKFKYACPVNTVADIENRACVPKGSIADTCEYTNSIFFLNTFKHFRYLCKND